jgi:hypothetical protein
MGLLSPLFLLGLFGVSLPILFHLIRRTPKGQMPFSTLMFLQPSPPRITRRSRLENLLLLLLRAAALALLAAAFSRPFLRQAVRLDLGDSFQRRVVIVVDGSASMQQPGVWKKVRETVEDVVAGLEPGDHPALFIFDESLTALVGFADANEFETEAQKQAVLNAMQSATPNWRATNIGEALVQAADILTAVSEGDDDHSAQQIVLISDLQKGASLDALQATPFPDHIRVDVRIVSHRPGANASVQVLRETEPQSFYRTRVVNGEESTAEQFSLHWLDQSLRPVQIATAQVYVAPGQNRVVQIEKPPDADLVCLELKGDESTFDNRYFVLNTPPNSVAVTYLGERTEQPTAPLYFLRRTLNDTPTLRIDLAHPQTADEAVERLGSAAAGLIVVGSDGLASEMRTDVVWDAIANATKAGARIVWIVSDKDQAPLERVLGPGWSVNVAEPSDDKKYLMWTSIRFDHPLFAALSNPRYSDFTGIRFWKWRRISPPDDSPAEVLAKFDSGENAVIYTRLGEGDVYLLAAGWAPEDSQLARSTKFLPIIHSCLHLDGTSNDSSVRFNVGDSITPTATATNGLRMILPSGERMLLDGEFTETSRPGIYRLVDDQDNLLARYAVNVAASETDTRLRDTVELEQYGVSIGRQPTREERLDEQRQLRDVELEKRQQLWRWGIALALLVLLIETVLAGRTARASMRSANLDVQHA